MIHRILALLLATWILFPFAGFQEPAEPGFDHTHALWTKVLDEFVAADRVDYLALSRKRSDFDRYLLALSSQDPAEFGKWTKPEQCAFLVNAYNAFTWQAVLLAYPLADVDSLRDVGGKGSGKPWKEKTIRLGRLIGSAEELVSLEELSSALHTKFKDARIHAALCTSCLGSPALRPAAFTGAALDRELESAARAWLADTQRTRFDRELRRVEVSSVFDECRDDFVRDSGSVEAWIARYAPAQERAWIEAAPKLDRVSMPFDWKLNDVERDGK